MPLYSYQCDECEDQREVYHSLVNMDQPTPCPDCGKLMRRNAVASGVMVRGNYKKPIELQSMGFIADPEDVTEHRRRFPDVDLVMREGSAIPVVRSLGQKRKYMKAAGWADIKSFT